MMYVPRTSVDWLPDIRYSDQNAGFNCKGIISTNQCPFLIDLLPTGPYFDASG